VLVNVELLCWIGGVWILVGLVIAIAAGDLIERGSRRP
jgi:hypothetical protein